jgi:GGDEF domain-containing protein
MEEYTDYYLECISIDGRCMAPVIYNGELMAVILLGDRMESEEYTKEENYFIMALCETAGIVMNTMLEKEKLESEILELKSGIDDIRESESIGEQFVREDSLGGIKKIIADEFKKYKIESYALFGRSRAGGSFSLIVSDEKSASIDGFPSAIEEKTRFIMSLGKKGAVIGADDFRQSGEIREVFGDALMKQIRLFRVYPYIAGGMNMGFVIIFALAPDVRTEQVDPKIRRISRFLFNAFYLIQDIDVNCSRYTDSLESIYKKIGREIDNAEKLGVSLSLLLFSIKNFRRCYTVFGAEAAASVLDKMEEIITSRLGDYDFSARYGRSNFLIVLPGKDKKTALQLGTAIRNAVRQSFSEEMQLLMTFLSVQYPDDGSDLFTLLDILE